MSLIEIRITAPDAEVADRIARALVDRRLAACVQQLPDLTSTYVWDGAVERATEVLLLAKTTSERFDEVCGALLDLHPYQTPEVVAVPVTHSLPAYEEWVREAVGPA